jgi:hypothetical protein
MNKISARVLTGWGIVVAGTAVALLIAWAVRAVRVTPVTLLTIGVVVIALTWLIVLVSMPWNLYFAARRVVQEAAVSRERGISVRPAIDAEARLISRRMLWLALGGHLGTAIAAAAIAYFSGSEAGYYIAGIFLLATAFRPAGAYLAHLRERVGVLTRESTHPREDVATIRAELDGIRKSLAALRTGLQKAGEALGRTEARLTDTITHTRSLLATKLDQLRQAQETDRAQARARHVGLERQADQMTRRIEATLDGISDHEELMTGLRALVRIIRSEPA